MKGHPYSWQPTIRQKALDPSPNSTAHSARPEVNTESGALLFQTVSICPGANEPFCMMFPARNRYHFGTYSGYLFPLIQSKE